MEFWARIEKSEAGLFDVRYVTLEITTTTSKFAKMLEKSSNNSIKIRIIDE